MELLKHFGEWFYNQVSSALLVNIIVAGISWFVGFIGRKGIERIRGWILSKRNTETKKEYADSIISFDTVIPFYDPLLTNMSLNNNRFIFEIPEPKRTELASYKTLKGKQKFAIHEPAMLDGDNHELYYFLQKHYAKRFPDSSSIDTFLNEIICNTVDYFIGRIKEGKLAFNNRQIGIDYFNPYRTDKDEGNGEEKQTLDIELYETDYFTAQVMVHVYQYLCQLDKGYKKSNPEYESPFDKIDKDKLNNEMRPFMSSLGVGGYIIFDRGDTGNSLEYWTVKRSSNVRNGSRKHMELRSYSFDETMDLKDCEEDIKDHTTFSAYVGANRAIQEELGLFTKKDEKVRGNVGDYHLTNLILIRTQDPNQARFEMQLLGYTFVHFSNKFKYDDLVLKKWNAQDASYEAVEVYPQKLKEKLVGTLPRKYTHTPESVFYADILLNMEDMQCIRKAYREDAIRLRGK